MVLIGLNIDIMKKSLIFRILLSVPQCTTVRLRHKLLYFCVVPESSQKLLIFHLFVLQGAGHNDVELYNQYLERLRHFVSQELTN